MNAPPAADMRTWSLVDFDGLGFDTDPRLQRVVDRAVEYVLLVTGQTLAAMPTTLVHTAEYCFQLRTEQLAYQQQTDYTETLADYDLLSTFSAGSYSESRRQIGEALQAKVVNASPPLNDALIKMMTPEKYDDWMAFFLGQVTPGFAVAEIDNDSPWAEPSIMTDPTDPDYIGDV